jgi:hypothetical protein
MEAKSPTRTLIVSLGKPAIDDPLIEINGVPEGTTTTVDSGPTSEPLLLKAITRYRPASAVITEAILSRREV